MSPRPLAFLIHGGSQSIEAVRARGLSAGLPEDRVVYFFREDRRAQTARRWQGELAKIRPALVYVINTAMPGAPLAIWWSWRHRVPFVLDTGDLVYEMARRSGVGAGWRLPLLRIVESVAQRRAAAIVVRGTRHQEYLVARGFPRVELIRDGYVAHPVPAAEAVAALRRRLGLGDRFVVGVLGSLVLSPHLGICYGWDLIGALGRLRDLPVAGLVIGDGDGLPWLRDRARETGVLDRLTFTGRIPYSEVALHLRVMDVALSTQTNNLPGQVRTTGKLPEYMAAGRFILASRVGEAALLLPEPMLVDYEGEVDRQYPERLAERIRELTADPTLRALGATLPARARTLCSYEVLAQRFERLVTSLAPGLAAAPPAAWAASLPPA